MRTRTLLPALLGAAVVFTTSGCDVFGGGGGLDPDTYTIDAVGSDGEEQSGAVYGVDDTAAGDEGFVLVLGESPSSEEIDEPTVLFVGLNTDQPEEGSTALFEFNGDFDQDIPDGATVGVYFLPENDDNDGGIYVSTGGRLRVTDLSDDDDMEGTFSFEAVNLLDEDDEITISGEFNAERDDDIVADIELARPGQVSASAFRVLNVTRN